MRAILASGALFLITACGGAQEQDRHSDQAADADAAIDMSTAPTVSATEYYYAFKENAVSAMDKFGTGPFILTGVVKSVEITSGVEIDGAFLRGSGGQAQVNFIANANDYSQLPALMPEKQMSSKFKAGDEIALLCRSVADIPLHAPANCEDAHAAGWRSPAVQRAAAAPPTAEVEELKARATELDKDCRGSDHDPDDAVCSARDRAYADLESRGICWAYSDLTIPPPDYRWHDCAMSHP